MSLRLGCSWSATTSGTRDDSGVPSGADESVPNHDCRYNPSRLQPTARRMRPPWGDQTGAPPNAARRPSSTIVGESYSRSPTIPPGASWASARTTANAENVLSPFLNQHDARDSGAAIAHPRHR